jgi:hypothetical protein
MPRILLLMITATTLAHLGGKAIRIRENKSDNTFPPRFCCTLESPLCFDSRKRIMTVPTAVLKEVRCGLISEVLVGEGLKGPLI